MVVFSSSKNGGNYGGHLLPGLTPGVLIVSCEKIQNTRSNSSKTILPSLKITKNHIEITKKNTASNSAACQYYNRLSSE